MRRCQQFELYAAESEMDRGRTFQSAVEVERWVNQSLRTQWWWERFYRNVHVVEVNESKDPSASVGGWFPEENLAVIAMLPQHLTEHDVLHELAHPLAQARFRDAASAHDPFFARVLLELTFLVRGHESWQDLLGAFRFADIEVDETDEAEAHRRRMLG